MATLFLLRSSRCSVAASSSLRSCFSSMVDRKIYAQQHPLKKMVEEAKMISEDYVHRKGLNEFSGGMDKLMHNMKKRVCEIKENVSPEAAKQVEDRLQDLVNLRRLLDLRKLLDGSNGLATTVTKLIYSMRKHVEFKGNLPPREAKEIEDAVGNLFKFMETMKLVDGGGREKALDELICIMDEFIYSTRKSDSEFNGNATAEEVKEMEDLVQSLQKLVDLAKHVDGSQGKNAPHELRSALDEAIKIMDEFKDNVPPIEVVENPTKLVDGSEREKAPNEHSSTLDEVFTSMRKYVDGLKNILPPEEAKEVDALIETLTTPIDDSKEEKTLNDMRSSLNVLISSIEKSLGEDRERIAAEDVIEIENAIHGLRKAADCNYTELSLAFEVAADNLDRELTAGMRALSKFRKLGSSTGSPLLVLPQDYRNMNFLLKKAKLSAQAYLETKAQNEMRCIMDEMKSNVARSIMDEFKDIIDSEEAKNIASIFDNLGKAEDTNKEKNALNETICSMDNLISELENRLNEIGDSIAIRDVLKIEIAVQNLHKEVHRREKIINIAIGHMKKAAQHANTVIVAGMRASSKMRTLGGHVETPRV